ncbi:TPA: hypothetical protein PXN30_003596 [Yersinia enterocolitica]|uniref:hypothetical protein n=5 Tax=Enterobacterales TaxID=91347 RepID=UPI0006249CFA|nr:hypothetical protein [Yersinia enterocolitica]AKF38776.1 hypothetical protein FORC2_2629 [Yersinia enterocolitica]ALG44643.1 hypothetical protein LI89_07855 [Yersinia enterocolitica]EKN6012436.1 hypothetical protein [Yersinia enterocolitica]HDL7181211.1 hypothetical protein [Yersinia enterocolitica]HDL7321518.1 hypothetical protein [Yersinia enterocolitica]
MTPYLICNFEKQTLTNLVKESFKTEFPDIYHKQQIDYIYRYLKDAGCETVILEYDYMDKDYLEDYARYYVKGFNNSGYKSARLHFFALSFDHSDIDKYLYQGVDAHAKEELQSTYLGFMIIKPLPKTFIGRTCLKIYDNISSSLNKKCLSREYLVDLFGIDLTVNSIAFQEQDKVISACATTSIWSALHAIHWKNIRDIPSRGVITTNAINHINDSSNSFPNKELSNKQILRAIDHEKLKHQTEFLKDTSHDIFLNKIMIHINSGLPLILGGEIFSYEESGELKRKAGHAVTILGYKNSGKKALYVHDDRLGPFARATFEDVSSIDIEDYSLAKWGLILQEKDDQGSWQNPHEILIPNTLITVHYPKVRLPYNYANNTCQLIKLIYSSFVNLVSRKNKNEQKQDQEQGNEVVIQYDIELREISQIRKDFLRYNFEFQSETNVTSSEDFLKSSRVDFLSRSYARFQWVASFKINNKNGFKILFDATDIPQGNAVSAILYENKDYCDAVFQTLKSIVKMQPYSDIISQFKSDEQFFNSFLKKINESDNDYSNFLDVNYGKLRAPKSLKAGEFFGGVVKENTTTRRYYGKSDTTIASICEGLENNNQTSFLIWAVGDDGALLIGKEIGDVGHPSLTGFKPARIAGEIRLVNGVISINSKSGRYSRDYSDKDFLLNNALAKFKSIFQENDFEMEILPFSVD